MRPTNTRAEHRPSLVSIPGDALAAVMRAGKLLQDAGDIRGAVALYEHFISTLQTHELTSIEYLSNCVLVPDPEHPGTEMLEWSLVRSHPERYSLA